MLGSAHQGHGGSSAFWLQTEYADPEQELIIHERLHPTMAMDKSLHSHVQNQGSS